MGVHVKCSGLVRGEDIERVVEAGVDYIGLVLSAGTDAAVDAAADLALGARGAGFEGGLVGVFVDAEHAYIERAAIACDLDVVQLDGDESPERVREVSALRPVWKRVALAPGADGAILRELAGRFQTADVLVVDGALGVGGDAVYRSRTMAALVRERRVMLAGGFDAHTVGALVAELDPFGVEVSPDAVTGEGTLDAERFAAFLAAVREAERSA